MRERNAKEYQPRTAVFSAGLKFLSREFRRAEPSYPGARARQGPGKRDK